MNERNIKRAFARTPQTSINWIPNTKTGQSGGWDSRVSGTAVPLSGWVTTPRPNEFIQDEKGRPVMIDNKVYFLGNIAIGMDDYLKYIPKGSLSEITAQVKKINYKAKWDFTFCQVQFLKETAGV